MNSYKLNSRLLLHFISLRNQNQSYCSALPNQKSNIDGLDYMNLNVSDKVEKKPEKVEFPPILDMSKPAKLQRGRESWYNKIKKLGIIEEKIFELNMPRYYGWKVSKINECILPYDPLPPAQYVTRTAIDDTNTLPDFYNKIMDDETLNSYVTKIKEQVQNAIVFEYNHRKHVHDHETHNSNKSYMTNVISKALCQQIHRIIISNLNPDYPYLLETQTDHDPRIEAFWFFGGLERAIEYRKGRNKNRKDSINEAIKYSGSPILTLRNRVPLKEIMSLEDAEKINFEIPVANLDLRKVGYVKTRERATVIPGFWPGDYNGYGVLSYHKLGHLDNRRKEFQDELDAVMAQAIFGSFSWLYTQACYRGFSTFQDVTYPFVNQTILTNGKLWYFFVYQLNTTTMHIDCIDKNLRKNICWMTKPMELFHSVTNDSVEGLNEDVLKNLIRFYANEPQKKEGINSMPYVRKERLIANIKSGERRAWVEQQFKYLMSNRERHFLTPEIYQYQDIFVHKLKIMRHSHQRFKWQLKVNPFSRRLNEHTPKYIPRCLRKYYKIKYEKTYYPSVKKPKPTLKVLRYRKFY